MDIKNILVPIDFSTGSVEALDIALGHFPNASIVTLHVLDESIIVDNLRADSINIAEHAITKDAQIKLQNLLLAFAERGVPVQTLVELGTPSEVILSYAQDNQPDLIVMGAHGLSHQIHELAGNTAYSVSRKAKCATWLINNGNS